MKKFNIETTSDVIDFLSFIYEKNKNSFDAAEHLGKLIDSAGKPVFKEDETMYYEKIMNDCFLFCIFNKLQIDNLLNYAIGNGKLNIAA